MLKNTSVAVNKLLVCLCVLCAVFFVGMTVWYYLIPVENYQLMLDVTQAQAKTAQVELEQRMGVAETALTEATAHNEQLKLEKAQLESLIGSEKELRASLTEEVAQMETLPEQILQVRQEYGEKIRQLEEMVQNGETELKICYLTMDDGPNSMTADILAEMDRLDIKATFFTIGSNTAPKQVENLRAEMMAGHTVANHTYSHAYAGSLYSSFEEFKQQVLKQDEYVYNATGFHMDIFRFPSGSVVCHFMDSAEAFLQENGYQWIDWNANAYDAGLHALDDTSSQVYSRMLNSCRGLDIAVLLCHDFNPATYGALKYFVPAMQEEGYVFLPLLPQSHMFDEPLPVV